MSVSSILLERHLLKLWQSNQAWP